MSDIAISVVGLSKRYRLGQHQRYETLHSVLVGAMYAPFRGIRSCLGGQGAAENDRESSNFIWALKNVSFEIRRGDVIGIIGRNGAGKSTLLKVLSRITEPSKGYAEVHGHVGSLLEVGTGFHPELTGRDNIYLNGAILGIRKMVIDRKFDEIVAFAEIEKFLDTPVKHYSSGMYMRLAFAVAAHLEPEILLVDEVLAVGDASFQKKCLGKIGDVAKEGRTVVFVSHNLPAVQRLCSTVYLLEQGRIVLCSDAVTVVDAYYRSTVHNDNSVIFSREVPDGAIRFVSWEVANSSVNPHSCYTRDPCTIQLRLIVRRSVRKANFGIALWADDGTLVWAMRSLDHGGECVCLRDGAYQLEFAIFELPLRPGAYQILVSANDLEEGTLDSWYAQPKLVIVPRNDSGLPPQWQGVLNISGKFNLLPVRSPRTGGDPQ